MSLKAHTSTKQMYSHLPNPSSFVLDQIYFEQMLPSPDCHARTFWWKGAKEAAVRQTQVRTSGTMINLIITIKKYVKFWTAFKSTTGITHDCKELDIASFVSFQVHAYEEGISTSLGNDEMAYKTKILKRLISTADGGFK